MKEFFRPWRRRIGVLTLALALVFMAGWVRSLTKSDRIVVRQDGHVIESFASQDSGIGWKKDIQFSFVGTGAFTDVPYREFVGFKRGMTLLPWGAKSAVRIVPYWSIVVPLTALSAYLLLFRPHKFKPHKSPPGKAVEPISDEQGATS